MRAKVQLQSVLKTEYSETLVFNAVAKSTAYPDDGSDEDNTYARFSPMAKFEIQVANPELHGKFKPGQKFYVDFTPADS